MAKNIAIKVPGKHPQTGELTTFELKGQRMDIDIGGQAVPFSSTFGVSEPHKFTYCAAGSRIRLSAPARQTQLQACYQSIGHPA